MRLNAPITGLAVLGLITAGCGPYPSFPLRLYDLKERQLLDQASFVFVGTTVEVHWEAARTPIHWDIQPGVTSVRLVKLRVSVERVIRGSVNSDQITTYCWGNNVFPNHTWAHMPWVGQRAVHYLVNQGGVFRYVTDLLRSTTLVSSGAHSLPKLPGEPAEAEIARVLLTPGQVNLAVFTKNLSTSVGDAQLLAGFIRTLPLLQALLKHRDRAVGWGACISLATNSFQGQDECINKLPSGDIDDALQFELTNIQQHRANTLYRFKNAFLANPVQTARAYASLPGKEGVLDFLHLIAIHPDRELASRAQAEIADMLP